MTNLPAPFAATATVAWNGAAVPALIAAAGRAVAAGIETKLGNHSFRATGITAYLKNGGTLEKAAAIANHASTRTLRRFQPFAGSPSSRWSRPVHRDRSRSKKKAIVCLLLAASYPAAAAVFRSGAGQAMRSNSIPKGCWPLTRGSSA